MKKLFLLYFSTVISLISAQSTYFEDFDQFNANDFICFKSSFWKTWSSPYSQMEDALISDKYAYSGDKSLHLYSDTMTGGPRDIYFPLFPIPDSESVSISFWLYIKSNSGAYFNIQNTKIPGIDWAIQFIFNPDGAFEISSSEQRKLKPLNGIFQPDAWFKIELIFEHHKNTCQIKAGDVNFGKFPCVFEESISINYYPISKNCKSDFYIDNFSYSISSSVVYNNDLAIIDSTETTRALVNTLLLKPVRIQNFGYNQINSIKCRITDNLGIIRDTIINNLNINWREIEELYLPLVDEVKTDHIWSFVEIIEVNNSTDGDTEDNQITFQIQPITPGKNKKVLIENILSLACGWTPRAYYFNKLIENNFKNQIGIVNVHFEDILQCSTYSEFKIKAFHFFGSTGYPQALIDRKNVFLNFNELESALYDQISQDSPAKLRLGATFDSSTMSYKLELESYFISDLIGDYRLNLIMVEDSILGENTDYDQKNSFANFTFENIGHYNLTPDPINYNNIYYKDVARKIFDGIYGEYRFLPETIKANSNFAKSFVLLGSEIKDISKYKFIGVLSNEFGVITIEEQKFIDMLKKWINYK
ncbi:MAG: hypothetical protein IPG12_09270 [Saprospiraceae bacterium]|nr:hypothetical protein [Saprospiraceae bacterium]